MATSNNINEIERLEQQLKDTVSPGQIDYIKKKLKELYATFRHDGSPVQTVR